MTVCDFERPYHRAVPMHHSAGQVPLAEWPSECLWWQLKSERYQAERMGRNYRSSLRGRSIRGQSPLGTGTEHVADKSAAVSKWAGQ